MPRLYRYIPRIPVRYSILLLNIDNRILNTCIQRFSISYILVHYFYDVIPDTSSLVVLLVDLLDLAAVSLLLRLEQMNTETTEASILTMLFARRTDATRDVARGGRTRLARRTDAIRNAYVESKLAIFGTLPY